MDFPVAVTHSSNEPSCLSRPGRCLLVITLINLVAPFSTGQLPAQAPAQSASRGVASSAEQGQTSLHDTFERRPTSAAAALPKEKPRTGDTVFKVQSRTMYLERHRYDGAVSEALATGGWAGVKTGHFWDHVAFGVTGYTSQRLHGELDEDGTGLLAPGQEGYSVLGEAYVEVRLQDGVNLHAGRLEYDTPFINRNDARMTPNTFQAITLQGQSVGRADDLSFKYGLGYVDAIKDRNSEDFISMAEDAGADVERGVFAAGGLVRKGGASIGAIDYYCPDVINIAYGEAKLELPLTRKWKPVLALQMVDQRSVGDDRLLAPGAGAQQLGFKAELPAGRALFSAAYTTIRGDMGIESPWAGHPGYTSVQVEDFNRAGEDAIMVRAAYDMPWVDGLSCYTLWVHGLKPDHAGQFARDEYNVNVQWAPPQGRLKGLSLRLRYALVNQRGAPGEELEDLRFICNYAISF